MQQTPAIVSGGWVFVGRTGGLTAATRGCQVAQAAEALRRVRAAVGRHGGDVAAMRLRWLVPHGAKGLPADCVVERVAAGLLPPDVLVQLEARAPLGC